MPDGKAIVQDSATRKIIILGYQYPFGNTLYHNIVVLDSLGNQLSQDKYGPAVTHGMVKGKDKSIYFTGYRYEIGQQNVAWYISFVAKFSVATPSVLTWYKEYKPKTYSSGFHTIVEKDNGFLLGGQVDTTEILTGYGNYHLRMAKIDKEGKLLWDRTYKHKTDSSVNISYRLGPKALELTPDGGWIMVIELYNTSPNPFFFVKFESTGCDTTIAYCS